MRNWLFVLCIAALMGCFVSCDDDTEIIYVSEEAGEEVLITDQSGTTVLNTKDIVIGEGGEDVIFEMSSTILDPELGKVTETTLNACGMGAIALDGNKADPSQPVENVTVINRGTITVHTKELVEQLERIYKKKSLCGNINNIFSKEDEAFLKLVLRELIKRCQEMSKNNSKWYAKKYKELLKRLEKIKTTYN